MFVTTGSLKLRFIHNFKHVHMYVSLCVCVLTYVTKGQYLGDILFEHLECDGAKTRTIQIVTFAVQFIVQQTGFFHRSLLA